ncbi:carboxylesterase family protein [Lentzea chajnantorensis]
MSAALSDMTSVCPTAELRAQTHAFGYEFAEPDPPMTFQGMPEFPYGAYHGSELPSLFGYGGGVELTARQRALADEMAGVWTRFARTGRPGWARQDVRVFATGQVGPADHRCDLWTG